MRQALFGAVLASSILILSILIFVARLAGRPGAEHYHKSRPR